MFAVLERVPKDSLNNVMHEVYTILTESLNNPGYNYAPRLVSSVRRNEYSKTTALYVNEILAEIEQAAGTTLDMLSAEKNESYVQVFKQVSDSVFEKQYPDILTPETANKLLSEWRVELASVIDPMDATEHRSDQELYDYFGYVIANEHEGDLVPEEWQQVHEHVQGCKRCYNRAWELNGEPL
jgi:hypothetical protein